MWTVNNFANNCGVWHVGEWCIGSYVFSCCGSNVLLFESASIISHVLEFISRLNQFKRVVCISVVGLFSVIINNVQIISVVYFQSASINRADNITLAEIHSEKLHVVQLKPGLPLYKTIALIQSKEHYKNICAFSFERKRRK